MTGDDQFTKITKGTRLTKKFTKARMILLVLPRGILARGVKMWSLRVNDSFNS